MLCEAGDSWEVRRRRSDRRRSARAALDGAIMSAAAAAEAGAEGEGEGEGGAADGTPPRAGGGAARERATPASAMLSEEIGTKSG